MKRLQYRFMAAAVACVTLLSATACGDETDGEIARDYLVEQTNNANVQGTVNESDAGEIAVTSLVNADDMFTDRDLSGEYKESECILITLDGTDAASDSKAVSVSGGVVTITDEGTYLISGMLQEGMLVVDAEDSDKVQLVLENAEISNSSNAAIYVKNADKVFLTLAEGSKNSLSNGGSYAVLDDNNIDGVIFSKSDITVNGSGSLEITAQDGHGIVSKDDLKIAGGNLQINVLGHGLAGKDSVRVAAGTITVISGKDGIRSDNEEDSEKGYVYIAGGTITITADGDGVDAVNFAQLDAGECIINAGNGHGNKTVTKDAEGNVLSAKGIKVGANLVINGGKWMLDAQDDALHSNGSITINAGEIQLASGDDGIHSDVTTNIVGGDINITASYEGIEGNDVIISGGNIKMVASDDGINAAGGNDQSGFGGFFGGDRFGGENTDSSVIISGGIISMNADGDGVDSNGALIVSGGELYISGPENGANGALDYTTAGQAAGGTVVAVGSMQMAMNFDSTSTQGSILISTGNMSAGTSVILKDSTGKELVSYVAETSFNSVLITSPLLTKGNTYTVSVGSSDTEVVLDELIYGSGNGMGGFGGHGGMGGFGGQGGMGGFGGGGRGDRNNNAQGGNKSDIGGNSQMPNGEVPDMSEMPQMPNGEVPDMSEMPQMPNGEVPNMGEMPQMPNGEVPNMGEMPQMPNGEVPNMGEMPQMPNGEVPNMPGGQQNQSDTTNTDDDKA